MGGAWVVTRASFGSMTGGGSCLRFIQIHDMWCERFARQGALEEAPPCQPIEYGVHCAAEPIDGGNDDSTLTLTLCTLRPEPLGLPLLLLHPTPHSCSRCVKDELTHLLQLQ